MRGKLSISFLLRVPDEYNSGIKTYWFCPYQINFLYIPVLFVIQKDHEEGETQKEQQGQNVTELPARKAVAIIHILVFPSQFIGIQEQKMSLW